MISYSSTIEQLATMSVIALLVWQRPVAVVPVSV